MVTADWTIPETLPKPVRVRTTHRLRRLQPVMEGWDPRACAGQKVDRPTANSSVVACRSMARPDCADRYWLTAGNTPRTPTASTSASTSIEQCRWWPMR